MSEITWLAHYDDGSALPQYPPEGGKNIYPDIDRDRLQAFDLWQGDRLIIRVDMRDDTNGDRDIGPRRLIWRKRTIQNNRGDNLKLHLIGWQRKVGGRNVQAIGYVTEDGAVLLGGQFVNDSDFMFSIRVQDCEQDLI